jgi:hypothetical protein
LTNATAQAFNRAKASRQGLNGAEVQVTTNFAKAMKNPSAAFGTPEVLSASTELTADQKRAILLQWKDQLQQLLVADDESMLAAHGSPGANADCLRRVTNLLTRLDTGPA